MVSKSTGVTLYVSKGENPESLIPDVTGLLEEEALSIIDAAGFKNVTVIKEESIEKIDEVFSQTPVSGTIYDKTLEIIIKVSKGIEVPDVINMAKSDAMDILEGSGFTVEISPSSDEEGEVINQIPSSGEYLDYGSVVTIEIKDLNDKS